MASELRNLVRGLVYEKLTTISHATNKEFGEGQMMGLISKEATETSELYHMIAAACHMLLNTSITFCYLSYYFGWSFALVVITASFTFFLN